MRSLSVVPLLLVLTASLAGCLGDDIWREPFLWRQVGEYGENQDAAQAFAAGLAGLTEQAESQGEEVVTTVDQLPDNVAFQNMREFLNRQNNGTGDQVDGTIRAGVDNGTAGGAMLTGTAGEIYAQSTGPVFGTRGPVTFEVAERATAVRWVLDVTIRGQQAPESGQNPTPIGVVYVNLTDARGAIQASYQIDTNRHVQDMAFEGTFGGRNEVRRHLGGTWSLDVDANIDGAWALTIEAYEPEFTDWEFYQFWRAQKREVTGQ